ncbi:MAG TPA: DUF3574 domain-containing protein [Caulobacteraceae bacterium]
MRAAALAALALLAGGAEARPACPAGLHPVTTAELFFGLDDAGVLITEVDWKAFVDREVTPRFPAGLTVWDARGQWRNEAGSVTREPAKVMLIVLVGQTDARARLAAVIQAYKARFHQRSVLLTEHLDCVSF